MKSAPLRLGVNVDHVATIRNARGGRHPDPVRAAKLAIAAGADGITAHLREDRRHIRDDDMARLKAEIDKPLNFEMAATNEMAAAALAIRPHAVCIVPEKRSERTTEGGLDVVGHREQLKPVIHDLKHAGIRVSLFIAPHRRADRGRGRARRAGDRTAYRRLVRCAARRPRGGSESMNGSSSKPARTLAHTSALKCTRATAWITPALKRSPHCRRSSN